MKDDVLKELKCQDYKIIIEENKNEFRKEHLKENIRIEWYNIKNEPEEKINKVVRDKEMFILIRDGKIKMEVWIMWRDFDNNEALIFLKEWDELGCLYNKKK